MEHSGYVDNDKFHVSLARWISRARIVQARLDKLLLEHQTHRIRLLPTYARRIDLFTDPETYGGYDQLIKVPSEDMDRLLAQYDRPQLFQFVSDDLENLFTDLHMSIGSPSLNATVGWDVFRRMVMAYLPRVS
ncbi:citrate synthase I [Coprinopsis cinerea AmutBmut pab1-1]|nr:citrate synthase I [Coprinopsis cinerea AmutBmut pab1-1]